MKPRHLLLSLFLLSALPLHAQQTDTLTAATVYSVKGMPVVRPVESARLEGMVRQMPVADVLRRFTGVQVKDYGGAGGLKTVNVRSLGSEHVGIFLDGIQIDNAQNMQVDLGRFSTDALELIELYNGQKSSRLQTAKEYTSGAAVHLTQALPDRNGLRLRLKGGSFGTVAPSVRWDRRLLPGLMLRTGAEFLHSNGRYKYPCFDTTLVRENGDIRSLRLEAQLFGKVSGGTWRLRAYTYGSERGFPGPVIRRASGFPFSAERQADQDFFVQGSWEQEWSPRYATALRGRYGNDYTHYNTHPERNPMALPYDLHYRQQSGYFSLAQSFTATRHWSVDLATDLQLNSLRSDMGQFVTPFRTSLTGALASRWAWERFRAAAHLAWQGAWDRFHTPQAGGWSRERTFRDAWMPALSLSWQPLPWLRLDAFAKRSYRLPSFNDLYYSLMGNASLVPESARQLGLNLELEAGKGAWRGKLRVSPYLNRIDQKIVAIPTASQFRWTMLNIGLVDITGLDVKAESGWEGHGWGLTLVLRYSFQEALDHSTPGSLTYGNQIPYIPRHSGSAGLSARWKRWNFLWDSSFCGKRWSRSANTADYAIAPWTLSDASLSYEWEPGRSGAPLLGIGLHVGNVFNRPYEVVQGYPMPGTNATLSVEVRW